MVLGTKPCSVLIIAALLTVGFARTNGKSFLVRDCPERCRCDLDAAATLTVSCVNIGLSRFPQNINKDVSILDLSDNFLTEIPASINELFRLKTLNVTRNRLAYLPLNWRGLHSLCKLDLTKNEIYDVALLTGIGTLANLKELRLSGNGLRSLDGLRSNTLTSLTADSCGIVKLNNATLSGLPELTYLSLANNPLKEINQPYSLKLKTLDLSRCQLGSLRSHTFRGFPELTELRMADNPSLTYSSTRNEVNHSKLRKLDVSRCNLDRPGLQAFQSLTHARLSGNNINTLSERFSKNSNLTHLYLDQNHLSFLNKSTFAILSKLKVLDLSGNRLKTVPMSAFSENLELKCLNLSDNLFQTFPKLISSVVNLDFSKNLIKRVEPNALLHYKELQILNLSRNSLTDMPSGLNSSSLVNLVVKKNRISSLENINLSNLPELEILDISNNNLTSGISPEIFFDNVKLRQLHLQDNPWDCDCAQLYSSWIFVTELPSKSDPLVCRSPRSLAGQTWKSACAQSWKSQSSAPAIMHNKSHNNNKTWGLVLVSILTVFVLFGTIISIRHSVKLKRQERNQRIEVERSEARERMRLLQRRGVQQQQEQHQRTSEPRIHPLELIGPPSYEEAVSMTRLARSLNGLDSCNGIIPIDNGDSNRDCNVVIRMTASSESLRSMKKRRGRRIRKIRSQSEDNIARREQRREERLRKARNSSFYDNDEQQQQQQQQQNHREEREASDEDEEVRVNGKQQTPVTPRSRSQRVSVKRGTSTDDENSDPSEKGTGSSNLRRIGKTMIRNLDREPRSGYRPSTDDDS